MTGWWLTLCLLTGIPCLRAQSIEITKIKAQSEWKSPLGKGFFLPKEEIGAPRLGGRSIFKDISDSCFRKTDESSTTNDRTLFQDTETFYRSLATDSSLSVELEGKYTMGATLNAKTKSMSRGEVDVTGTSIDIWNHVSTAIIEKDCIAGSQIQLSDDFMLNLNALPNITKPERETSWVLYHDFLTDYGSHVVTQTYYGSSLKHWTFSRKDKKYTQEQINLKSCVDFEGPTNVGQLNVTACAGVTHEQVKKVMNLEMSSNLELHGGSDETRNQLQQKGPSTELITKFLNEGRKLESPVKYKYTPIWDILRWKYSADPRDRRYAIALNLEQYYMGFLDFGCSLLPPSGEGLLLRRFKFSLFSSELIPHYVCELEKEGCHSDNDCQAGWFFHSFCSGPTCVEHVPASPSTKADSAKIRKESKGYDTEGINQSCYYQYVPIDGKCITNSNNFDNKIIWKGVISYIPLKGIYF